MLYFHIVFVNFTARNYEAEVGNTEVIVRVTSFGYTDTPFIVNIIPDAKNVALQGICIHSTLFHILAKYSYTQYSAVYVIV